MAIIPKSETAKTVLGILAQIVLGGLVAWACWTTKKLSDHETRITVRDQWVRNHEELTKDKTSVLDRLDRDSSEWRMRTAVAMEESKSANRSTDMAVRDVAARLSVMSDTLIRLQEGNAAIREKMISIQVHQDELNNDRK